MTYLSISSVLAVALLFAAGCGDDDGASPSIDGGTFEARDGARPLADAGGISHDDSGAPFDGGSIAETDSAVPDDAAPPVDGGSVDPDRMTTGGSGGTFVDSTFESFTASNRLTSEYHLFAGEIDPTASIGLMVQFHGDGAYEFLNPTSTYSLGGRTGLRAQARARNMILLVALSPDTRGSVTWWESGSDNADYVRDLIQDVAYDRYDIDLSRVWLNGFSGGAQFITQFFMPKHSRMIHGGGAVIFGGGGLPRVPVEPFTASLRASFPMHWYTGADDDGSCSGDGYNALRDAQRGSAEYAEFGFATSLETPAGVCHNLSGRFGPVTGAQLDRHD